jgi:hypothetical protein
MKLTEAQAKELGMVKDARGNWVKSTATEIVESHKGRHFNQHVQRSPEAVRESIISSAIAMGLTRAEAEHFAQSRSL